MRSKNKLEINRLEIRIQGFLAYRIIISRRNLPQYDWLVVHYGMEARGNSFLCFGNLVLFSLLYSKYVL